AVGNDPSLPIGRSRACGPRSRVGSRFPRAGVLCEVRCGGNARGRDCGPDDAAVDGSRSRVARHGRRLLRIGRRSAGARHAASPRKSLTRPDFPNPLARISPVSRMTTECLMGRYLAAQAIAVEAGTLAQRFLANPESLRVELKGPQDFV